MEVEPFYMIHLYDIYHFLIDTVLQSISKQLYLAVNEEDFIESTGIFSIILDVLIFVLIEVIEQHPHFD